MRGMIVPWLARLILRGKLSMRNLLATAFVTPTVTFGADKTNATVLVRVTTGVGYLSTVRM